MISECVCYDGGPSFGLSFELSTKFIQMLSTRLSTDDIMRIPVTFLITWASLGIVACWGSRDTTHKDPFMVAISCNVVMIELLFKL